MRVSQRGKSLWQSGDRGVKLQQHSAAIRSSGEGAAGCRAAVQRLGCLVAATLVGKTHRCERQGLPEPKIWLQP